MKITIEHIASIVRKGWGVEHRDSKARELLPEINAAIEYYNLGAEELVLWLGQCIWECGFFHRVEERYVAPGYSKPGQQYEGRKSLGNTQKGDGSKFIGRGMIQITGRKNYQDFSEYIEDPSIMEKPSQVAHDPYLAVETAFWYWFEFHAEDTDRTCEDVALDTQLSMQERCLRVASIINRGEEEPKKRPNHMRQRYFYTKKVADTLSLKSW